MKKIILTFIIACCSLGFASAQERGNWGVGPRVSFYTHAGTEGAMLGIGAIGRYAITNHWRVEPAISVLCEKGCSIDAGADIQYLFRLAPVWKIFPAVGYSVNDIGGWSSGFNIGAGTDFSLARRWDLTGGVKWMLQTVNGHKNPLVITVGAVYKF